MIAQRDVAAVVVSYRPADDFPVTLARIAGFCSRICVVDNGSGSEFEAILQRAEAVPGVNLLRNETNAGIAAALNRATETMRSAGFAWALTLDQDSLFSEEALQGLLGIWNTARRPDRIGLLAAVPVDEDTGFEVRYSLRKATRIASPEDESHPQAREARIAITSGNLLSLQALQEIGGFATGLFIDAVDFELCFRLRAGGYRILEARDVRFSHRIGKLAWRTFLGRRVLISNHPPVRRYYMMRNRLYIYTRYLRSEWPWVWRDALIYSQTLLFVFLFEDQRFAKLKYTLLGVRDFLLGRYGRAPGG